MTRALALGLWLLWSAQALARVGTVEVLEGSATRATGSATPRPLAVGDAIEQGDVIKLAAASNLKLTLVDGSVLMLAESSELYLDEASFDDRERLGVSLRLALGSLWAKVTRSLGGHFQVVTDRAVAGV